MTIKNDTKESRTLKTHKTLFFICLTMAKLSVSTALASSLVGHSLKKLDVAGTEMVLLQAFVTNETLEVKSLDDHLGISQKEKQVSLYMDYQDAHPTLKEALSKKSYIRNPEILNKLISQSFKTSVNEQTLNLKFKP